MTAKQGYKTEKLCIYRKNSKFQTGTSRELFSEPFIRPNIGVYSASFVYILSGTGKYVCKGTGETYPFHPGTVILKDPQYLYDQHHDEGVYIDKYIVMPLDLYEFFMKYSGCRKEMIAMDIGINNTLCRKFDDLIDELRFQCEQKLSVSMMHLAAFAMDVLLPHDSGLTLYRDEMEEAIRLLEKDFGAKISLQDLAEAAGMSRTNFRRIFKEYYGISPIEYRIRKKIELIQETMRTRRGTVKELAERFGYPDAFAFSRQFKQYSGISPRDFLKKLNSKN